MKYTQGNVYTGVKENHCVKFVVFPLPTLQEFSSLCTFSLFPKNYKNTKQLKSAVCIMIIYKGIYVVTRVYDLVFNVSPNLHT